MEGMRAIFDRLIRRKKYSIRNLELFLGGNSSVPNVLIFTEYINATYFISFDIPLRSLHARGEINFAVASQKHVELNGERCWELWSEAFQPDVVVMTRYGQADGQKILEYFHQRGIPIIYHIDDDLLEMPESLGTEIRQRHGAVVETRTYLLRNCDLIYASTSHLAHLMQSRFSDQKIFYGIHSPYMGELIKPSKIRLRTIPVIGYMGSKGHQHDLELIVPTLKRLLDERVDMEFEVFGTIQMPKEMERFGKRVRSHSVQKSYTGFLSTLSEMRWDIGLAPLEDCPFNRCRSSTKFIEYTACGIPVIASNMMVYSDAIPENGGLLIKDDWYSAIAYYLDHSDERNKALNVSKTHCAEKYSLEILEKQLIHVFKMAKSLYAERMVKGSQ